MTTFSKPLRQTITFVLVAISSVSSHAAITVNAITVNALTNNAITVNALTNNALTNTAITVNALTNNGLSMKGLPADATIARGLYTPSASWGLSTIRAERSQQLPR